MCYTVLALEVTRFGLYVHILQGRIVNMTVRIQMQHTYTYFILFGLFHPNATRMIGGMSEEVLRKNNLSKNTKKLKVVNATMIPTLMYECEAWSLSKKLQSRVQATQMRVFRRIEGVHKVDRVRNEGIRERLGQEGISDLVKRRQEKWLTRFQEMNNDRTTKQVFTGDLEENRPKRPPRIKMARLF